MDRTGNVGFMGFRMIEKQGIASSCGPSELIINAMDGGDWV